MWVLWWKEGSIVEPYCLENIIWCVMSGSRMSRRMSWPKIWDCCQSHGFREMIIEVKKSQKNRLKALVFWRNSDCFAFRWICFCLTTISSYVCGKCNCYNCFNFKNVMIFLDTDVVECLPKLFPFRRCLQMSSCFC